MKSQTQTSAANRGRRTQEERTALSNQRMFEAAIDLILERGIQKTTLKEIGERAGYSRGLVHSRYGSKEDFLNQLFVRFDARWKRHLNSYVGRKTGIDAIKSAVEALCDFLNSEASYMRAMYVLWYESVGHEPGIKNKLAHHHRIYREDAIRWIEAGINEGEIDPEIKPEQFAVRYCAFIFGIVYQWLVDSEALDLDAVFQDYNATLERQLSI